MQTNEVSLNNMTHRIKSFFTSILYKFYSFFDFIKKNKIIVSTALILGITVGGYLDYKKKTTFTNEVVVATNFGTNNYLYSSLNNYKSFIINSKGKKEEKILKKISGIKITPLQNPYNFLAEHSENLDFFQILSERGMDVEKYFESKMSKQNYRYHTINFSTNCPKDSTEFLANYLFNKINTNAYFNERMSIEKENIIKKKTELQKSVSQINQLFIKIGNTQPVATNQNININEYNNLDKLIEKKQELLEQIDLYNIYLLEGKKPINEVYSSLNNPSLKVPKTILFPLILLILFSLLIKLRVTYQSYKKQR